MSDSSARRPLALTATLATSVAAAAGMISPAHATTPSPNGTANLTISGGNSSAPSATTTVTGTKYALNFAADARDLVWAPTGARAAWIDATSGAVLSGVPGGASAMVAPAPANGTVRTHPTWIDGGARVVWSEKAGSGNAVLKWAYANGLETDANGTPLVHDFWKLAGADVVHPDAVGSMLVFQVNQGGGTQVYAWDLSSGSGPYAVADGWDPSVSPDGSKVAFIAAAGGADNINVVGTGNPGGTLATPTKVTGQTTAAPNAFENPVWTPDGKGLVFQWLDAGGKDYDTQSVSATGTGTTSYAQVVPGTRVLGMPAFQPSVRSHVIRVAGTDRVDTAIKTSQSHWGTAGSGKGAPAKAVVLSRSDQFADALGGSALAAKVGGPLLLTPTAGLTPQVQAEIQRVLGAGDGAKTVYVLGGEKALAPAVANALSALHYKVQRVAGPDRYSTAVQIAETITGSPGKAPDYILVATGQNFPDALSAGAAAGAINAHQGKNAVVLLTNNTAMPQPTADYLAPLNARTNLNPDHSKPANFIELDTVGKQAETALKSQWIPAGYQAGSFMALSGLDRYETSFLVARYFFGSADAAGLATGMNWADALSGGAEMGTEDGPLLLVNPAPGAQLPAGVAKWLGQDAGQFNRVEIFGGNVAVPTSVDKMAGGLIAGPGGVDYSSNPHVN
ncbi:cell wall-binding repeat-containing protein [Catenulispora subtropica]|uniref:WD40 domain protein beta Propeller n=1 Tax=Catenulispora subtropica TaxID=450798 RepID=A0ABP5C4V3_9ACTN